MTNKINTVLYTGVTGKGIKQRVWEHKEGLINDFAKRYNVNKLVYFELCDDMYQAISREKQIKGGSRVKKVKLIESMNPSWQDLYDSID
ncbi:MAG: GIY-YIG nuclease family protein [Candidatus Doudnabacteria bacterium]|nr:GIY-YIG nuclease family protein [Candidatus Doudnabacteria bacterium]